VDLSSQRPIYGALAWTKPQPDRTHSVNREGGSMVKGDLKKGPIHGMDNLSKKYRLLGRIPFVVEHLDWGTSQSRFARGGTRGGVWVKEKGSIDGAWVLADGGPRWKGNGQRGPGSPGTGHDCGGTDSARANGWTRGKQTTQMRNHKFQSKK